ncbi:MAG: SDR family NAD(P)-dependent oxidoreductase [bacterium]|nr:SDR family NAD(P)-dependent oxidoreductase [bacterium]
MPTITTQTVFLVSGGARGITAQCVIELAHQFRCKFILLGRTPQQDEPAWAHGVTDEAELKKRAIADMQGRGEKPTPAVIGKRVNGIQAQREIAATLNAVKTAGGDAVYLSADVTHADALRAALVGTAGMGRITAILHGAGNLADKLIENKTEADFENVYAAKVAGLENLLAVVPPSQLETLVLFSSVAGFYGNVGQADYAIANDILNKTAHWFKQHYPACHVVSVNWGPWDGGMVTPQLRAYFDQLDIRVIPVDVGTRMLADELRRGANPAHAPAQIVIGSALRTPPAPPSPELHTYRIQRTLILTDNPFLGDHVVNAQAVLPMVSAMSWMSSACEQIHRGFRYFGFDNYRVLKGIVFDESLADVYTLELKEIAKSADEIVIDALVRSQNAQGKLRFHYSATITLRVGLPEAPALETHLPPTGAPIPGAPFYQDGTLFHGYSFQGVDSLLHLSERGIRMRCVLPPVDDAYQGQFPVQAFNYFMADIGLQSIGIWSRHFYKMGSLPLRAAKGRHFRHGEIPPEFFVTMEVQAHSETNVTAKITLHDAHDVVYLIIDGLEVTMSARLNDLFLKNRLPETLA